MNEYVNLDKKSDILKYSFNILAKSKLSNFKGKFYEELFAEAKKLEKEEKDVIFVNEIELEVNHHVEFGQRLVITGSVDELGSWDIKRRFFLYINLV